MASPEIDQIVDYTKKFIEAATPIAKQAYEVGLVTLRIDAVQTIATCVCILLVVFFAMRKIRSDYKAAAVTAALPENRNSVFQRNATEHLPLIGIMHGFVFGASCIAGVAALIDLVNAWLWVKLFAPQLWLAHIAVEKIVG